MVNIWELASRHLITPVLSGHTGGCLRGAPHRAGPAGDHSGHSGLTARSAEPGLRSMGTRSQPNTLRPLFGDQVRDVLVHNGATAHDPDGTAMRWPIRTVANAPVLPETRRLLGARGRIACTTSTLWVTCSTTTIRWAGLRPRCGPESVHRGRSVAATRAARTRCSPRGHAAHQVRRHTQGSTIIEKGAAGGPSVANGRAYVGYGWTWGDSTPPGGLRALGVT